jgi:DNA-binding HxlR family transcriptional regulator
VLIKSAYTGLDQPNLEDFVRDVLGASHSIEVLLFLRRQSAPIATNDIMRAVGVTNWATMTMTLRRLESARMVVLEERNVGRYKSRAKFWTLEPTFGAKVAASLEEANRWGIEAARSSGGGPKVGERPAIVNVEEVGEKLVTVMQEAVRLATGN